MSAATPVGIAALLVALAAGPTIAVPDPLNSTIPSHLNVVALGPAGPGSAPGCTGVVVIRDLAANPVPGAHVTLDFSNYPDVVLATDQLDPGLVVVCAARTVTGITDANGQVSFTVLGRGAPGIPPSTGKVNIYDDFFQLGQIDVGVLDRDGVGGLTLSDLALWTADYFGATNPARSDFDGIGGVQLPDLGIWAQAYFNGTNAQSVTSVCP